MTVDGQGWYAPPLIYTRDDSSGLWIAKSALPPEAPLLSPVMKQVESGLVNKNVFSDFDKATLVEPIRQDRSQELADGDSSMETIHEHVGDGPQSRNESDSGTKKRRVEDDISSNGIVTADSSLHGHDDLQLVEPCASDDALLINNQGVQAGAANASVAERLIEPTLVMLEVKNLVANEILM